MFRGITKKLIVSFCTAILLLSSSIQFFAADFVNDTLSKKVDSEITAEIIITDPETGEVWKWDLPETAIKIQPTSTIAQYFYQLTRI